MSRQNLSQAGELSYKMARILNRAGTIIMILLILICAPFTLPRLFGLHIYEVKTESMEPEYPVGSVVYVRETDASDIVVGDVITYTLGTDTNLVMTHRVIGITDGEHSFITKGDANPVEDAEPVRQERLIGQPILCIPGIAVIANFMNTSKGEVAIACVFVLVFVMWLISERMQKRKQKIESDNQR